MAKETKKVEFTDPDHVWIDGTQFVSLNRFNRLIYDLSKEKSLLNDKVKDLTEENKALKILLKGVLNDEDQ